MIAAMMPAPFRFLEMEKEELRANPAPLDEAKLGVAPEALDPVDGILAAGKLVFVAGNAPVFVTAQEQAIVAEPAVGLNGGWGKHLSFDDRLHHSSPQQPVDPQTGLAVDPSQFARSQRRHIRTKHLQ
jgi:hypothetical protein